MKNDNLSDRGQRIQASITAKGTTQAALAEKLGITKQALNNIAGGRAPGEKHLPAIAAFLDVPLEWLRDGGPPPARISKHGIEGLGPNTPEFASFIDSIREAMEVWHRVKDSDQTAFQRKVDQVPARLQRHFKKLGLPWHIDGTLEEVLAILAISGVSHPNSEDFSTGYHQLQEFVKNRREALSRHSTPKDTLDQSLPLEQFEMVRKGLLLLRAERNIFNRPVRDVERTLRLVWKR